MTDDNVLDLAEKRRGRPKQKAAPRFGWSADLMSDEDGKIITNLANVIRAFQIAPCLQSAIKYNEFTGEIDVVKPLPVPQGYGERPAGRAMDDADIVNLTGWMQSSQNGGAGWLTLKDTLVERAVPSIARQNSHHPLRERLDGLPWDGKRRIGEGWLHAYLGAQKTTYHSEIGRYWLLSAVARVFEPGCQADSMLILEGAQGSGKSTALRILAGDAYFKDDLPADLSSKDTAIGLRGSWIIEISELASMRKTEVNSMKAFTSRRVEKFRPPFGKTNVNEARQCVFAGTVNPDGLGYLKDATGNRRFWPVKTGKIDLEKLKQDRDQIWAEAVWLHRHGSTWWPTPDQQRKLFAPEQVSRMEVDPWVEQIDAFVESRSTVTAYEIARIGLDIPSAQVDLRVQKRIREVLAGIGWTKGKRNGQGNYVFTRPE